MQVAGIVSEYDPFHNGHAAHIAATRSAGATHIVTVMSGSFTQRGEPACFSKFARAEMALKSGADLVLELPLSWAMAPAERFAAGGMGILHALGCVSMVSFGSECGDEAVLRQLASADDDPAFSALLRENTAKGLSYAAARQNAVAALYGNTVAARLSGSNDILGTEYIRAAARLGFLPRFVPVLRQGAGHGEAPHGIFASAGFLRDALRAGRDEEVASYIPPACMEILRRERQTGHAPTDAARLDAALLAQWRRMEPGEIARLPYISEGLEHRFYTAARHAVSAGQMLSDIQTKRYPAARLRRILWSPLLEIDPKKNGDLPPYIRVLGMTQRGKEILSAAVPTLPILSRWGQVGDLSEIGQAVFAAEERATDLHALTMEHPVDAGADRTQKLITV